MSVNANVGCPITGCDTLIPVTIDLVVGGPDVLPRRQVPGTHIRAPGISVHPELSSDAVARVTEHLKLVHPAVTPPTTA